LNRPNFIVNAAALRRIPTTFRSATPRRPGGATRRGQSGLAWLLAAFSLVALLPLTLHAQPAHLRREHTEEDVVAAVQVSNVALNAARVGASARGYGPAQVRWPFPMVEVMPMLGMTFDGDPGMQIMARQPIPWRSRLSADRTARERVADAARYEAAALELDLVAMARMTYAELWGVQEQAARMQEFGRQLGLYREAALAQYAAGRGPQQAVLTIQVERSMLAQRVEALEEQHSSLAARIAVLTGGSLRIAPDDRLAPPPAALAPPAVAPELGELASHPMLQAGQAMQEAELAMAEMNRTMLRPEFTVGVNLNLSKMAFDRMYGLEPVMPAVGVMLPLWRGGIRASIREAELRAKQRELETANTALQHESEFNDVSSQLARVRSRIAVYENRLRPEVRQTLDANLAGYHAGTMRFLELLEAQRMALDVELDLIMARVRAAELTARMDAASATAPPPVDEARVVTEVPR
jgi:outer membrane protein, heavy metal efflux system